MSKAWIFQDPKHVKKVGAQAASYYVGWIDPAGRKRCKSCGPGKQGRSLAREEAKRISAKLITDTYEDKSNTTWEQYMELYRDVLGGMDERNRDSAEDALAAFDRHIKPVRMSGIDRHMLITFVARRRKDPGKVKGSVVSPATVNRDLRYLRAALKEAVELKVLKEVPKFKKLFLREPERLPCYVTPEDFAKLYAQADTAEFPVGLPCPAGDWWKALLVFAFMTGWRIGAILKLRRADVDLDASTALTRGQDNKGRKDRLIFLHSMIVEHLRRLAASGDRMFPWPHGKQTLFSQFAAIQKTAGVKPTSKARYGFHDLRRAFATMNADRLTADVLQQMMQHKSYTTTQLYISLARQMKPSALKVYVPELGDGQKAKAI